MNRSLPNVIFGGIAQVQSSKKIEGEVTTTAVDETVDSLVNAESVIIVRIFYHIPPIASKTKKKC